MNVAYYLTPKMNVACLQSEWTVQRGLRELRAAGYTSIPVITKENKYIGTASEGDFLWFMTERSEEFSRGQGLERHTVGELVNPGKNGPVRITATVEELIGRVINQNFVPVIDDLDNFVGIVTRRSVISHLYEMSEMKSK